VPDASTFGFFLVAALAMLLVPGPSVLYIVARSVDQGRTARLVSMLGVETGALVHVAFAAAGLSAILASSAAAFGVVKWLGAAVVVERERLSHVFSQGVVVNVLNPKTALFFLAFLPQFVDLSGGAAWAQVMVFGATFVALAVCTDGLYALLGSTAGGWPRHKSERASLRRGQRYFSGGVYLALGAATAVSGSGKE
jgi:threonine/homoserine/homoserine lactone efflux protein